jgi:3-hexulose-6-phosphate synthase
MDEKMEISPEGLLKRFSHQTEFNSELFKLSTPQLTDALKNLINYVPVIQGVKPLKEDFKILGKAITAKTSANDWGTVIKAINLANKGDVLFISADSDDSAVWGELTSKSAQRKELAGTVVCGAVRDVNAIRNLNYPVFSKAIVPNAGAPLAEGELNVPLKCGDITVNPYDMVLGDDCGVVVVPGAIFSEALNRAMQIKKDEQEIINKIDSGYSLSSIINPK